MTALERARLDARLTVAQLAARAKVSRRTITRAEGGGPMSDATLFALSKALRVHPLELRENGDRPEAVA